MVPVGQFQQGDTLVSELFVIFEKHLSSRAYGKRFYFEPTQITLKFERVPVISNKNDGSHTQVYRPSRAMDWPGKNKPEAEPGCGFLNEHCPKDDTQFRTIISIALLIVLIFGMIISSCIYRRWKIEQEIEGLLWKIDPNEIRGYPRPDNMMSSPSKVRGNKRALVILFKTDFVHIYRCFFYIRFLNMNLYVTSVNIFTVKFS